MLLVIDNYDSFTYNIVQYFKRLGQTVVVYENECCLSEVIQLNPQRIVISPGPNGPEEAGISLEVIRYFYDKVPILGVCLGHQCLAYAFGASIVRACEIVHGKTSAILHHRQKLFRNLPNLFQATRYHSLAIEVDTLPSCFSIDAWAGATIMAISHRQYPLYGLQFHPESILSEYGLELLHHFCMETGESCPQK